MIMADGMWRRARKGARFEMMVPNGAWRYAGES